MAAPQIEDQLVVTMLRLVPDLEIDTPDYMPQPDQKIPLEGLGTRISWTDIYHVAQKGYDFYFGSHPSISLASPEWVQQQIHAAIGEMGKAYSSFLAQSSTAPVALARILDGTVTNIESNMLHDYRDLSQRLDAHDVGFAFIHDYIVPELKAEIAQARAEGYAEALQAQKNAQEWARDNIFAPLQYELGTIKPAIDQGVAKAEQVAHNDALAQVTKYAAEVGAALGPIKSAVQALQTESEDCVQPMCETMGPKTNLGKFLKGLQLAADAALLADLAGAKESDIADAIRRIASAAAALIGTFERDFLAGGSTLAGTITDELSNII